MGYNQNLSKKQNALLSSRKANKKYIVGQSLRIVGIIGLIITLVISLSAGDIFWGFMLAVAISYYTLPIVPILCIAFGLYLITESKK